ncbi:hypothetical protein ESOMN_v1c05260 [Williamsoniiplasma somnilux]|uniref:Uncharacterized protein n=1 Tax=Williamsoniiplasma somnilux TaxID=215578 RepID=A0A2K8P0D6_9MOLU|nr:hypothetical protein [Williamsoniiplasma somnilux]ATZ18908.1 hypothetical protein ESOMN_v1c05260 [Williamsoniiplasma somnilux]
MSFWLLATLSIGGAWGMLAGGILCIVLAIAIIFLYKIKRKNKERNERSDFKETASRKRMRFQMFSFWSNYTYIFLIGVGFVAGIILTAVGVGALV